MATRQEILEKFQLFSGKASGIESWLTPATAAEVLERLGRIDTEPLSKVQFNQLLILSHEADISDGFFRYYWLTTPVEHPYDVTSLPGYDSRWISGREIKSLDHLRWGLYRLYVDALLFFGNIRFAYRHLRVQTEASLQWFFMTRQTNTEALRERGPALTLVDIPRDDRYLISEMACKSYGSVTGSKSELKQVLDDALDEHFKRGGGPVTIGDLLDGSYVNRNYKDRQQQFRFSADDILKEMIQHQEELDRKFDRVGKAFDRARKAALANTRYYLSMANDLDVYVATSMRTRHDFRSMADACTTIFSAQGVKDMQLRYFDPTMSAAEGHEDKGLIECLMVKCARVLIYCAGEKESYGKDAEAAMALSLGKPVIFYCDGEQRSRFYREVHPLSRLIHFETGVAVGVMATDRLDDVSELLRRIFENKMEYELEQPKPGYYRLKEKLTGSVIRLQTNDDLLRETFWNYYHNRPESSVPALGPSESNR